MTKLVKVELVDAFPLYDITVEDDHCFQLENGVIAHNSKTVIPGGTAVTYSANQIFVITKAQEKGSDGELDGWKFTINIEKSRFVREKAKLPFQVMYDDGIQKYSGLLDISLEIGAVISPNSGWYSRVNLDTGEVESTKWRKKDMNVAEFWDQLLESPAFKKAINEKFKLAGSQHFDETEYPDEE